MIPSEQNERMQDLAQLYEQAMACRRCDLRSGCQQVVFADGNPAAPLMLVGEGPGEQEDIQGKPFVGRAGQLLDRILAAIGLDRRDVYIANVVKCRPPGNRTPTLAEADMCWPWLAGQLEIIQPKLVVGLGTTAIHRLIDPEATIGKLRGRWITSMGFRIMPTYHPAALLRNPSWKSAAWEDFQKVQTALAELGYPFRQEVAANLAKERQGNTGLRRENGREEVFY